MAFSDLLIALRERVPLSAAQIATATGTDENTVAGWLERRGAPSGIQAQRVAELTAFVDEMARNVQPDHLPEWLGGRLKFLDGAQPLDMIAAGRYDEMMSYAFQLTYGVFT
jgi:transcriptional regulator with XRE-family HTH domain